MTQNTGRRAEEIAKAYLLKQGLTVIDENFRCRMGEIDLIMQDRQELVFVEVRYRANNQYGGAIQSVDYAKQTKICKSAAYFLQLRGWQERLCRFDVLSLTSQLAQPEIQWIKHAFEATT